jgi:hypothetical protein
LTSTIIPAPTTTLQCEIRRHARCGGTVFSTLATHGSACQCPCHDLAPAEDEERAEDREADRQLERSLEDAHGWEL